MAPDGKPGVQKSGAGAGSSTAGKPSRKREDSAASDQRRRKKREMDRKFQRDARQRTKSRLAYLENLVETLRREDPRTRVDDLATQLNAALQDKQYLVKVLKGLGTTVQKSLESVLQLDDEANEDHRPGTDADIADRSTSWNQGTESKKGNNSDTQTVQMEDFTEMDSSVDELLHIPADDHSLFLLDSEEEDLETLEPSLASTRYPVCARCDPLQPAKRRPNLWSVAHQALGLTPVSLSPTALAWEDEVSTDFPVRAVTEGWTAAEKHVGGMLPPLWAKLRKIDEIIFPQLDRVARLAILIIMHSLLRYNANPTLSGGGGDRIPPWYLARPHLEPTHSYAIDFFAWPGMRNQFIIGPHNYCSNKFWTYFNSNLRIAWNEDFRSCFHKDNHTGLYSVRPEFHSRIFDLNAWCMQPDFFSIYPEFRQAINPLENSPSYLMSGQERLLLELKRRERPDRHGSSKNRTHTEDQMCETRAEGSFSTQKLFRIGAASLLPDHDLQWLESVLEGSNWQ